jgi:hypothetical protein
MYSCFFIFLQELMDVYTEVYPSYSLMLQQLCTGPLLAVMITGSEGINICLYIYVYIYICVYKEVKCFLMLQQLCVGLLLALIIPGSEGIYIYTYIYMYIYIYTYMYIYTYICVYIYIFIWSITSFNDHGIRR